MNGEAAEKLLNPDLYQVFLLDCPPTFPLSFARHPWFVVNKKGAVSRWEIAWKPERYNPEKRWGHLVLNILPPFKALRVFHFSYKLCWKGRLLGMIEGDEGTLAAEMAECITRSPDTYPYTTQYAFTGSNSNTYAQWVIDQFPESGFKLAWNAFGKDYLKQGSRSAKGIRLSARTQEKIRYVISGVTGTVGVYYPVSNILMLTGLLWRGNALLVALVLNGIVTFLLHRHWTFRNASAHRVHQQMLLFSLWYAFILPGNLIGVWLFSRYVPLLWAQLITTALLVPPGFIYSKYVVFKEIRSPGTGP